MDNMKLDICDCWLNMGVVLVKDKSPIVGNEVYAYLYDKDTLSDEMQQKIQQKHGLPDKGNYGLHEDCLINMLYFAAIKAKVGIRIFGLGQDDVAVSYEELHKYEAQIDQLESIFGYITKQSTLEELARDLNNRKLFYSTPFGRTPKGKRNSFFAHPLLIKSFISQSF